MFVFLLAACSQSEGSLQTPSENKDYVSRVLESKTESPFPNNHEWINRSCPRDLGPSLWSGCVEREAAALKQGIPDLSEFDPDTRAWIVERCPVDLPPSLTKACREREASALKNASISFDLDGLSVSDRKWLLDSCPRDLGPSLFLSCIQREGIALEKIQAATNNRHREK